MPRGAQHLVGHGLAAGLVLDELLEPVHQRLDDGLHGVGAGQPLVHHLEPQQIVQFMSEALRVARHAVLINDLVRHRLHLALAYAGYAIYRSRLTRHDAIASVRRAYTIDEIIGILRLTSAVKVEAKQFFMFRMGVIAWKRLNTI